MVGSGQVATIKRPTAVAVWHSLKRPISPWYLFDSNNASLTSRQLVDFDMECTHKRTCLVSCAKVAGLLKVVTVCPSYYNSRSAAEVACHSNSALPAQPHSSHRENSTNECLLTKVNALCPIRHSSWCLTTSFSAAELAKIWSSASGALRLPLFLGNAH